MQKNETVGPLMANVRRLLLAPTVSPCGVAHLLFLELFRIKWLLRQLKAFKVLANAAHRLIGNKKEHKTKTKSDKKNETVGFTSRH